MRNFMFGLAIGLLMGAAGTAVAAQIVGQDGFLMGWEITKGGEVICDSPWVWTSLHEIDCD